MHCGGVRLRTAEGLGYVLRTVEWLGYVLRRG